MVTRIVPERPDQKVASSILVGLPSSLGVRHRRVDVYPGAHLLSRGRQRSDRYMVNFLLCSGERCLHISRRALLIKSPSFKSVSLVRRM